MLPIIIQENVSLQTYNTFGIVASARYFVEITSIEALQQILQLSAYQHVPKLFLGGGSNILLTQNFDGLVIKINLKGLEIIGQNTDHVFVKAGAGESWHGFVLWCIAQDRKSVV